MEINELFLGSIPSATYVFQLDFFASIGSTIEGAMCRYVFIEQSDEIF